MKWAYGITTVPARSKELFLKTLQSLKQGGFEEPRLFVDGGSNINEYEQFELPVSLRNPKVGTFANWYLALAELFIRNPNADRFAIFQDDFVTYKNLRQYLEQSDFPDNGYWNLLTMPVNQRNGDHIGFYKALALGKGAVANVFNVRGVQLLLASEHILSKPADAAKGKGSVDGGIISTMHRAGWLEYVHHPSLVFHTGKASQMNHGPYPDAISFKGEDFDALDLIPLVIKENDPKFTPDTPLINLMSLGNVVDQALHIIGVPKKKVEDWLARSCGSCPERRVRMNRLEWWVKQIIKGRVDEAKVRFQEMLDD